MAHIDWGGVQVGVVSGGYEQRQKDSGDGMVVCKDEGCRFLPIVSEIEVTHAEAFSGVSGAKIQDTTTPARFAALAK